MVLNALEHRRGRTAGLVNPSLGWSPNSIDGCSLWLAADRIFGLNDDDKVASWPDSSLQGYDATQVTEANRPTYKTNIVNGLPVVRFAGAHYLTHTGMQHNLSTYFVVWKRVNATYNDIVMANTSTTYAYLQYSSLWYVYTSISASVAMPADTWYLKGCVYDNSTYQRYTNGSAETGQSGSGDAVYSMVGNGLGGNTYGDIAEIIIYNTNLDTTDRQVIENYLNSKYAIW